MEDLEGEFEEIIDACADEEEKRLDVVADRTRGEARALLLLLLFVL